MKRKRWFFRMVACLPALQIASHGHAGPVHSGGRRAGDDTFGLGFQVTAGHGSATMRPPGSLGWAGIDNTQFWIDPDAGIGAVLPMRLRPFYDGAAIETPQGFKARLCRHLR